jgi:hypothetical protein
LKTVFGEAGERLVCENMINNKLQPIINGKKIEAIFVFILIEDFDKKVEFFGKMSLQKINQISKIVHEECIRYKGEINRNLGEVYFLLWRLENTQN